MRYRGYYFDAETGFYYLQSRYYDPTLGRFLNADSYASTGQGFLGYNMFAYCNNHSISRSDKFGLFSCYENDIDGTCSPEYHYNNHSPTTHSVVLSYINNSKAVTVKANSRSDKGFAVDCTIMFDEFNGEFSRTEFVKEFCKELTKAVRKKEKELIADNIKIAGSLEYDHILAELRAHYLVPIRGRFSD